MATGWIKTLSAAPLRIAISAAPNSVLLNGMIRLPSEVLPSANSTIASPAASRWARSLACSPDVRLRSRSTNIVRCRRPSVPKIGQPASSDLEMKQTPARLERMVMSDQETWFEASISGRWLVISPCTVTRKPSAQVTSLCQTRGMIVGLNSAGPDGEILQGREQQPRSDHEKQREAGPDRPDHVALIVLASPGHKLWLAKIAPHDKRAGSGAVADW